MKKGEQPSPVESITFESPKAKKPWEKVTSTSEGRESLGRALEDIREGRVNPLPPKAPSETPHS